MRKLITVALVLSFFVVSVPVFAGEKSAVKAFQQASDDSVFDKISDWFATLGKSDQEKQRILAERRAKRAVTRAKKEADKTQKQAQKKAQESQKDIKKGLGIK